MPFSSASPSLGAESERGEPGLCQSLRRGQLRLARPYLARPDHRRGHMCERCQISRSADRALRRDNRGQTLFEHRAEQRDRRQLNARGALREAGELQRHHQPRDRHRHGLTHPGGMAQHDIALEGQQIIVADLDAREFPEAGVDPVNRLVLGQNSRHCRSAGRDICMASRIEQHRFAPVNGPPIGQRHGSCADDHTHSPLWTRA